MSSTAARKNSAYAELGKRFARMGALQEAAGMLHWDMAAVMPEGGHESRAEQLATINVIAHQILTSPETGDLLARAGGDKFDDWQAANLREMRPPEPYKGKGVRYVGEKILRKMGKAGKAGK